MIQGSKALVQVQGDEDDDGWTFAERILENDRAEWEAEKRKGAGRDKRLLYFQDAPSSALRPLFRECNQASDANAELKQFGSLFEGTSSA